MTISYLLDENLRGPLWRALQQHNARGEPFVDVVRVGDPDNLPLGTLDSDIRRHTTIPEVVEFLALAAYASEPREWQDRIEFIG